MRLEKRLAELERRIGPESVTLTLDDGTHATVAWPRRHFPRFLIRLMGDQAAGRPSRDLDVVLRSVADNGKHRLIELARAVLIEPTDAARGCTK